MLKEGDIVYIHFVGGVKDTGEIFDLTREDIAKKEGIFNKDFVYKPVPIIIGAKMVLQGLEEEIKKMDVGESKTIELEPKKAFGERDPSLIKHFSLSEFKKQNIDPKVGDIITVNNIRGRIISISGGRVVVDFNHPLAGKTILYDVEIIKKVDEKIEKVKAILEFYLRKEDVLKEINVEERNGEIIVFDRKNLIENSLKEIIANTVLKWVKEVEKLTFLTTFKRQK